LTTGSTQLLGNGSYTLALSSDGGTGSAGTSWSQVATSTLDLSNLTLATPFVLNLQTLNSGAPGALGTFDDTVGHTWTSIVTFNNLTGSFSSGLFSVNTANFGNALGNGAFAVVEDANGTSLDLVFVPEPSAVVSFLSGCGLLLLGQKLRRRRVGA
jgi:hypothetical protein